MYRFKKWKMEAKYNTVEKHLKCLHLNRDDAVVYNTWKRLINKGLICCHC